MTTSVCEGGCVGFGRRRWWLVHGRCGGEKEKRVRLGEGRWDSYLVVGRCDYDGVVVTLEL